MNPTIESRGYGTSIVRHLIDEATLLTFRPGGCHDVLFLDVYTSSDKAITLYNSLGFVSLTDAAILDPLEGKPYRIMACRIGIGSG